jgi:hypothetical protein
MSRLLTNRLLQIVREWSNNPNLWKRCGICWFRGVHLILLPPRSLILNPFAE